MTYRKAVPSDIEKMTVLLLTEGQNEWNYLPEDKVRQHLEQIRTGETQAFVVDYDSVIAGFVSYNVGIFWPQYEPPELKDKPHGYIAEAVVYNDYRGLGIAPILMRLAISDLENGGFDRIYAIRHEENAASARLMEKTGFEIIDTFNDPVRRHSGSRRTTVCRLVKG